MISFRLVSYPVRLFASTEEHCVSFRQIHVSDGRQIRYRRVCDIDGEEVPYSDIARGYELPDGQIVVLTDADFAQLPLPSSRAIQVLGFADADTIDPVRLSRSYYCDPTGSGAKAYVLLREALERTGKVALVKVALRQRESQAVLHPRNGVLVLHVLLWPDEVRRPRFRFLHDDITLRPGELQAAESYIHTLTAPLDPHETVDQYQAALKELVEAKVAGRQVEQPPAPRTSADSVANLMDALRRSVEEAKHNRGDATPATRPPRKRTAKPTTTKQAATKPVGAPQPAAAKKTTATRKSAAKKTAAKKTAAEKSAKNR